jgi:hypothetical protein
MYNILRIVILVVSYYVLRCMYCILCYLITKLTCSIEEPLCGNAIKSLLLLLLLLIELKYQLKFLCLFFNNLCLVEFTTQKYLFYVVHNLLVR